MISVVGSAFKDVQSTWKMRRVWLALATEDISDEHKRTTLGPIWLLVNYVAFVGTFCFVVFDARYNSEYVSYVAVGLFVWFYISDNINNAVGLFVREEGFIKGTPLPISLYVMRQFMQSCIRSFYSLLGCIIILILGGTSADYTWFLSLLSLFLILLVTPPVILIFAFLGAFIPDAKFLIQNAMRIGMFLTPVFWSYENSGGLRHYLYWWNPFTYFLEIVRDPIVEGYIHSFDFMVCVSLGIFAWLFGAYLLGKLKKEVVFVL